MVWLFLEIVRIGDLSVSLSFFPRIKSKKTLKMLPLNNKHLLL